MSAPGDYQVTSFRYTVSVLLNFVSHKFIQSTKSLLANHDLFTALRQADSTGKIDGILGDEDSLTAPKIPEAQTRKQIGDGGQTGC